MTGSARRVSKWRGGCFLSEGGRRGNSFHATLIVPSGGAVRPHFPNFRVPSPSFCGVPDLVLSEGRSGVLEPGPPGPPVGRE